MGVQVYATLEIVLPDLASVGTFKTALAAKVAELRQTPAFANLGARVQATETTTDTV